MANGITMRLLTAHTEGVNYRVEVCYTLPDGQDWLLSSPDSPKSTYLSYLDKKVTPYEEGTMYWRFGTQGEIIERCEYLIFLVKPSEQIEALSLTVESLFARKVGEPDYCLEISQKMVERGYSVTIGCSTVKGIEGRVYVQFPLDALVMDPAYYNIVHQMKWDRHRGPWRFTFPVNPQ